MSSAIPPTPWYRQFWPWFIMAFPASAVFAGIATVIIATQNQDSLVADDYYKEGLAINQSIERDQVATRLGLEALVRMNSATEQVSIQLSFSGQTAYPDEITLTLTHPTLSQLDQHISLPHQGQGLYLANIKTTSAGDWHATIEPSSNDWRLTRRVSLDRDSQVRLSTLQ